MSTVFVIKGVSDPADITEVEAEIKFGEIAVPAKAIDGGPEFFKRGEFALTREDAEKRLRAKADTVAKQRLKALPERYTKAVDLVNEIRAELVAAGLPVPDGVVHAETVAA